MHSFLFAMSFRFDTFWEDREEFERIKEELQSYKEKLILQVHWEEPFISWQEIQCIKFKINRGWNFLEGNSSQNN